jgi:hypothetical protein
MFGPPYPYLKERGDAAAHVLKYIITVENNELPLMKVNRP